MDLRHIKLMVLTESFVDGSTFYRALQPLRRLRSDIPITFEITREFNPAKLMEFDGVLMLRPNSQKHYHVAKKIRDMGLFLWIEFDDDLFNVPYEHEAWAVFESDTSKNMAAACCQLAHKVTVSTDALKDKFKTYTGVDAEVFPNCIDDTWHPEPKAPRKEPYRVISWRGGETHGKDLESVREALVILARRHDVRFCFMGMRPICLRDHLPVGTWTHIDKTDYVDNMYANLGKINAPIHMIPLCDIPLNRSKSNLAWIEATWFGGSACIGPSWWDEAGVFPYKDQEDFVKIIEKVKSEDKFRIAQYDYSVAKIKENYVLSKWTDKRIELLYTLMGSV